jgi:hypothetical protein
MRRQIMTSELFHEAKLKVKRADHHIAELNEILSAFLKTDFYRLSVEKDVGAGLYSLQFRTITGLPENVPVVISEIAQHLRSALDYAMCVLVVQAGGICNRQVQFPICETRKRVEEIIIKNRQIKKLTPAIIDFILDEIKPYKEGNDALYGLRTLNNIDKHRHLMPVTYVAALKDVTGKAGGIHFTTCTFIVDEGRKLNLIGMPNEFEFEGYGKPAFVVAFDRGQPFEGQAVVPTLVQLLEKVSGIIDTLSHMIHNS